MQQNTPSALFTIEGKLDVVNKLLSGAEFSPACDSVNPGDITLLVTATATGPMAKTETNAKLLPEGQAVKVKGTTGTQFFFASMSMNSFDKNLGELPVNGRVIDLAGNLIASPTTPMTVSFDQPYGLGCTRSVTVNVTDGFFESGIYRMSDQRSFKTKVLLNPGSEYLKIEQQLEYQDYIDSTEFFLQIQTVASADRTLAGVYRFRTINTLDYKPVKDFAGEYSISSKDAGEWLSNSNGEVFLEGLKVGLTNILVKENPDFFNVVVNGAKVIKGE